MILTDTILRNRYKILKELGRGGFSVTYLAVDMDLPGNPKCVVKQLKTRNPDNTILQIAKKLFDREAQVLYRLGKGHKQIPEMFAHFEENDEFYLVQEFVDGHDLTKEVKPRHRLSEEKVIELLQEILEVLMFVHQNNVIHRDIKLRNIMRRREDGKIVLIDFGAVKEIKGLAKNEQGDVNSTLIIGTPGYMPDEQANGKPRLCSDVYAVGMLGIQAVTGISPRELPFDTDTGELIWRNSAKVSNRLAEILTGMVRHHFSQRYQTAAEALQALKSPILILPNASSAKITPPVTLPSTFRKSRPPIVQSLGLVGLMGVGFGLGVFGWNFFQSNSNGNQSALSEIQDTTIKNISPSTKPQTNNNSNPSIFLPSTPKVGTKIKPVFSPFFLPLFNENKVKITPETPKSKTKSNKVNKVLPEIKSQPKPIQKRIQLAPKTSTVKKENTNDAPDLLTPEPPNNQESLPSISIPPSRSQKNDNSPTYLPSKSDLVDQIDSTPETSLPSQTEPSQIDLVEKPKNQEPEDKVDSTPQTEPSQTESSQTESSQTEPSQTQRDLVEKPKNQEQEDKVDSTPQTSLPSQTDSVEKKELENQDSTSETSLPSQTDSVDKPNNQEQEDKVDSTPQTDSVDKDKAASEEQSNQIPLSPSTPAVENESPIPTPSPAPTTGSVIAPTIEAQETTPVEEEGNNYNFIEVPTEATPAPEIEIQPTFSPQPTPTLESKTQPTVSPQPSTSPGTEAEIEPTPQASAPASPGTEAEIEPIPQASAPASPDTETEIEPTPQASAPASPDTETEIEPKPTPTPVEESGLSLEHFAI